MSHLRLLKIIIIFGFAILAFNCNQTNSDSQKTVTPNAISNPLECIQKIIAADDSLGFIRNHACEQISLSETIRQYVKEMQSLSFQSCPEKFTDAFKKHQEAWLALIPVVDNYPDLRGEMHDLFKTLESSEHAATFNPLVKTVWETWAEVEEEMKIND
jgi:hypothetical protein